MRGRAVRWLLAIVLLVGSATLAPAANLLVNPGFEDPIGTEWTATILSGSTSAWFTDRSTAAAYTGTYGYELRFGPIGETGHAYVQQVVSGLVPGGECTITGWLKFLWRADKDWGYIEALGGGAPAIVPAKGTNVVGSWVQYSLNQTADANGQLILRLHLDKYATTVGDKTCTVYFDDLTVEGPLIPEPGCMVAILAGIASMGARFISRRS